MTIADAGGGAADFDFLLGSWSVRHRKLRRRLQGDQDWLEFGGTMKARPILAGAGNFDENVLEDPDGTYRACTVRAFDPSSSTWSIFWIDGRNPRPDPPVIGSFADGEGHFLGVDTLEGRPITVRFRWSRVNSASPRWEQSFSPDGGATWEMNWAMDFERMIEVEREGSDAS